MSPGVPGVAGSRQKLGKRHGQILPQSPQEEPTLLFLELILDY